MKTDTTLRLTRTQYRAFAEQAKAAGICLGASSLRDLGGNWGMFDPRAKLTCTNADKPDTMWTECARIDISTTVNANHLRSVQRPEIDWSTLEDHEIYPFILAHELGHWTDNFCIWDIGLNSERDVVQRCERVIYMINEVLADRFAWEAIRPGEVLPLCEMGKRREAEVATELAFLNKYIPRTRRSAKVKPAGQYTYVPQSMLMTDACVAFVGTKVSPELIDKARNRRRVYRRDTRARG